MLTRTAVIDAAWRAGFGPAEVRDLLSTRTEGQVPGEQRRALLDRERTGLDELCAAVLACRAWLDRLAGCACRSLRACADASR